MGKSLRVGFDIFFFLICVGLTVWMVYEMTMAYVANLDSSLIEFRMFNDIEIDQYPTFSICLKEEIYDKKQISGDELDNYKVCIHSVLHRARAHFPNFLQNCVLIYNIYLFQIRL